jgi:hypothetical protein
MAFSSDYTTLQFSQLISDVNDTLGRTVYPSVAPVAPQDTQSTIMDQQQWFAGLGNNVYDVDGIQ